VLLAKHIVPGMVQRGKGRVLITASVAATNPAPYLAVYGATKGFDLQFAEGLRYELEDTGVTVTALQPGATDTEFFDRADMTDTKVAQGKKDDPADVAKKGFEAMMAGKDKIIAASLKSKVEGLVGEVLPETTKAAMQAKQTRPGSAKH
jgi:short-subunit dehydrogenase